MKARQFPDLIKAGLKVGDKVYSIMYGDGVVVEICEGAYPISVRFANYSDTFSRHGMVFHKHAIPSITLTPWNPIIGEPFPFPKWEPKEGFAYAFWDDKGTCNKESKRFCVSVFHGKEGLQFKDATGVLWDYCAPISEAMRIFGVKEEGDE